MGWILGLGNGIVFRQGGSQNWSSFWKTRFTGVPIEYSNNPYITHPTTAFRSIIKVGSLYHYFEECWQAEPSWLIRKRTSPDGLHFSNQSDPLLLPGGVGDFDEHGQADPTVIYDGVGDWKMWFDAINGADVWDQLGYATSADGTTWVNQGGVISRGAVGSWDSNSVHHPVCIKVNGIYYLYYSGSKVGNPNEQVGDIGLATSVDGINWTKEATNPVISRGPSGSIDYQYLRPSAPVKIFNTWYMWYWAASDATTFTMALATSTDLIHWTKQGQKLATGNVVTASCPLLVEGTNQKDKIIKMYYTTYPTAQHRLTTIALPSEGTKVDKFVSSGLTIVGNTVSGNPASKRIAGRINVFRLTVANAFTPDAIKVYIGAKELTTGPAGKIKLALYSNNVNTPQTLLASTQEYDIASLNSNEWNVFSFVTPPALTAADYWVAIWSDKFYYQRIDKGGTNNHGSDAFTYTGNFPTQITISTIYGYNGVDIHLIETRNNVYQVALVSEPTKVYFNSIRGNKKTVITDVDSEFDWFWSGGVLYVYSEELPDVRYQITYE